VVSALGPLLTEKDDTTWIAAALSDDDRAAARAGAIGGLDIDLRLLDLDPGLHRMHYDVVSNGVLWFLVHGLYDRIRRPRFDARFRDAWDAYVAVNEAFADEVVAQARERDIVLVQDNKLLVPGQLRAR
jgi:trehalose-6-phosphate synthase